LIQAQKFKIKHLKLTIVFVCSDEVAFNKRTEEAFFGGSFIAPPFGLQAQKVFNLLIFQLNMFINS